MEIAAERNRYSRITAESFFAPELPVSFLVNIIALPPCGLDILRVPGIVPEFFSQIFDMDHDGAVTHGILLPDALVNVVQRIDLLWVGEEEFQDLIFCIGEEDDLTAFSYVLAVQIQDEVFVMYLVFRSRRRRT